MKKQTLTIVLSMLLGAIIFGGISSVASAITATPAAFDVSVDGTKVDATAFAIEGRTYLQLRDIAKALDVGLWWDEASRVARLETDKSYDPDYAGPTQSPTPSPSTSDSYKAGMYKVGTDLPAGEYVLQLGGESSAYFEISSDSSGSLSSILANGNFTNRVYVTVADGEYFKLTAGTIYPVGKAPAVSFTNDTLPEGMYKVGTDLEAGEYKLIASGDTMAYVEVSLKSDHRLSSIVSNDNFSGTRYQSISNGQYIYFSGCTLHR